MPAAILANPGSKARLIAALTSTVGIFAVS
jgi:hypothetical protein